MCKIDRVSNALLIKAILIFYCVAIASCAPTVKVESPKEPITINLNIKLDADIRVKLEEEAKKDIVANPDIF
ncbi:YnbE family lipoprotein [Nitrosomonas supralitoralis]|uniref:YnbE family lipoprotein n=1 Tax=Nitrosomonas supralitoralis TaxID=2116706 RepID=A0A2P7NUF6_9PROT|nr:YnbE family lipoprotein [Nitrosomonas supralitoralis]PSJ17104.1 YnbE family lipoprotein [Nitrosomonas supralitoralis]